MKQILEHGHLNQAEHSSGERQMSAIIKLYDKNINSFKLNEQISFIGVLEFKPEKPQLNEPG